MKHSFTLFVSLLCTALTFNSFAQCPPGADSISYQIDMTETSCYGYSDGDMSVAAVIFLQDFEDMSGIYDTTTASVSGVTGLDFETSATPGRLQFSSGWSISGTNAATLDNPLGTSTNFLTQTVDMAEFAGDTNIGLSFWWYDHGDEGAVADRVQIRGSSGDAWIEVYSFATNSNNGAWSYAQIDVDAALSANAQTFTSTFAIRFGQTDNFPINTDGITIDDVALFRDNRSYSFVWSTGDTGSNAPNPAGNFYSSSIDSVPAGNYTVTITDDLGCAITANVNVNEPGPVPNIVQTTDATCFGANDAQMTGLANIFFQDFEDVFGTYDTSQASLDGVAGLDYETTASPTGRLRFEAGWSISGSNAAAMDNPRGGGINHLIQTVDLSQYANDTSLALGFWWYDHGDEGHAQDIVQIRGDSNDAWIQVYSFAANSNNGAWSYAKIDIDAFLSANGQTPSTTFAIRFGQTDNFPINTDGISIDDIAIFRDAVGYTFQWSNGDTATVTPYATGSFLSSVTDSLTPGSYSLLITDDNGCFSTVTTSVSEPTQVIASATLDSNASCAGRMDGGLTAAGSGGTGTLSYAWISGPSSAIYTGIGAGTYTVVATDENGCTDTTSATVGEEVISASTTANDVSCNGLNDGIAMVTATGGSAPYTYSWTTSDTTASISGLMPGDYSVTATDATGCPGTPDTITISEPDSLLASMVLDSNVSCNGGTDGGATVTATGGTMPYSYLWNNTDTSAALAGVAAGIYEVVITDDNGCTVQSDSVEITEPTAISLSGTATDATGSSSNGTITLTVSGGTPSYSYDWDVDGTGDYDDTQNLSNLAAGDYSVTVLDSNGCTEMLTVTVNSVDGIATLNEQFGVTIFPNPNNGTFTIGIADPTPGLSIEILDALGRRVFTSQSVDFNNTITLNEESGVYFVRIAKDGESTARRLIIE